MSIIQQLHSILLRHPLVCTDTRHIEKNSIFFALKGEKFDANQFAGEALSKGAAFAVVDDASVVSSDKFILVEDVLKSLQDLAKYHRSLFSIPFIAITGSNGKTTTKELLSAVLGKKYNVLSTTGNFNNHIGLPLTILRLTADHQFAVIEMGANHGGEIAALCEIAKPAYGLITNIGKAHLKGFGSYEGVKMAKTELYRFIGSVGGKLFVNAEDEVLMKESSVFDRQLYGGSSECRGENELTDDGRLKVVLITGEGRKEIRTQLFGRYNYYNVLTASCIGRFFGISMEDISEALSSYSPQNNRSQIITTTSNTVVLDAYNANPSSMELALLSFAALPGSNKIAILGDMLELGHEELAEHGRIIEMLTACDFMQVYLVGPAFGTASKGKYVSFDNTQSLCNHLETIPIEGCQILIKGSRGIGLERVLDFIP